MTGPQRIRKTPAGYTPRRIKRAAEATGKRFLVRAVANALDTVILSVTLLFNMLLSAFGIRLITLMIDPSLRLLKTILVILFI
jgi:hypothetical protein